MHLGHDAWGALVNDDQHGRRLVAILVLCHERYEKQQSIVLTSNKAFAEWGQVFAGDAIMASAALDRLLHRSTVINIRGESYRLKEKRQVKLVSRVEAHATP